MDCIVDEECPINVLDSFSKDLVGWDDKSDKETTFDNLVICRFCGGG
jgi:hypothetical protein